MKIKSFLASIALAMSASSSMATLSCKGAVTEWNSLGPPDTQGFGNSFSAATIGGFSDCYEFSLGSAANAFGGVIEIDLLSRLNINVSSVSLYFGSELKGYATAAADALGLSFNFGNLSAGDGYTLQVAGDVTGDKRFLMNVGYAGLITTLAAPVPEPGAVALMIAGLLGVGVVAWRRRDVS